MKTRIVSACSFAAKRINFSFTTTDDRNKSTCLWPAVARLASYSAADPRNDFSVCRAGTRTIQKAIQLVADRTARLCAAHSLALASHSE